ncbi:MAG: 5'/3'-nucleotidase SurE [Dongiaceae bacterium]
MLEGPLDLACSRILVTNDDGINAPGLKVLERVARALSNDVWVVAPEIEQSGAGHSLTLRRPLTVRQLSKRRFAVDGTPTDCVLVAVSNLMPRRRPDLVLSGVNRGANLGEDVTYSGTVSAALEATLIGLPAIALSQVRDGTQPLKWQTAEHHAPDVIRRLTRFPWAKGVLMNVNFPNVSANAVTGVQLATQGRRVASIEIVPVTDPGGRPYLWIGDFTSDEALEQGTDLAAVEAGAIAVTPLHIDLTHQGMMRRMKQEFA